MKRVVQEKTVVRLDVRFNSVAADCLAYIPLFKRLVSVSIKQCSKTAIRLNLCLEALDSVCGGLRDALDRGDGAVEAARGLLKAVVEIYTLGLKLGGDFNGVPRPFKELAGMLREVDSVS